MFYLPQAIKKDEDGQPVMSRFGGNMPYQTIPLNPSGGDYPNVDTTVVINYKSNNVDLQTLQGPERSACNGIKKWLNTTDCAVWYHNANTDLCSQFGGPHFHVVVKSVERLDGTFEVLQHHSNYKALVKTIAAAGNPYDNSSSYIRSQRVRSLPALLKYLSRDPRIFLGTRSIVLGTLRNEILADPELDKGPIVDIGCDDDELGNGDTETEAVVNRYNDFGPPPKQPRLGPVDRPTIPPTSRQVHDVSLKRCPTKSYPCEDASPNIDLTRATVGEQSADRTSNIIEKIMLYVGQYDYESLITSIGRLDPKNQTNKNIKVLWSRLITRPGTIANIVRIRDKLKANYQGMSFTEMAEKWLDSTQSQDDHYATINDSLDLLNDFCEHNALDFDEVCYSVYQTMNMTVAKKNTFMIIGPSNAGKTVLFKNTLMPLVPFNAQVGSVGNSGQFLWQMCPGNRAIFIEECRMAPEHIETCKLIFGGEEAMVDVKCKPQTKLARTPVFISTNTYPWIQAPSPADKQALLNRIMLFHCTTWPDLAEQELPLHPGMWWNICQAIEHAQSSLVDAGHEKVQEVRNPIDVEQCKQYSYKGEIVFDTSDFE